MLIEGPNPSVQLESMNLFNQDTSGKLDPSSLSLLYAKVAYKSQHIKGRGGIGLAGQTITLYTVVCMRHFTEVVQAVLQYVYIYIVHVL